MHILLRNDFGDWAASKTVGRWVMAPPSHINEAFLRNIDLKYCNIYSYAFLSHKELFWTIITFIGCIRPSLCQNKRIWRSADRCVRSSGLTHANTSSNRLEKRKGRGGREIRGKKTRSSTYNYHNVRRSYCLWRAWGSTPACTKLHILNCHMFKALSA